MQHERVTLSTGDVQFRRAGAGRPILFLHSAAGPRWSVALELLSNEFEIFAPTFPGYAGTETHSSVSTMSGLAALSSEFIGTVIGSSCDVVGHSLGGWVALWLALQRPDIVEHLVLATPAGTCLPGTGGLPPDAVALRAAMFAHPEKLPSVTVPPQQLADNRALLSYYGAVVPTDRELMARFGEIEIPTLVLHGTQDGVIPDSAHQSMCAAIPNSYLVYVWDAAHAIDVDQPEKMYSLVVAFLKRSQAFLVNLGTSAIADAI